jgi:hypothetical protein
MHSDACAMPAPRNKPRDGRKTRARPGGSQVSRGAASRSEDAEQQRDHEDDEKNEEQDLRNFSRTSRDAREAENGRDDGDDEEDGCVVKHVTSFMKD